MSKETLYLVNRDDQELGSVSREDAHNDPSLIHREVAVILISEDGKALLAQRSFKKKVLPGKWDVTCAGHVPYGMETDSAAHMELQEELGFDVPLEYIGTQLALYDWETHLTHLYIGVYSGEGISLQEEEVEQSALLTKEDVDQLGEEVNLEFRDFIYSALGNKLPPERHWKKEQDLRNL